MSLSWHRLSFPKDLDPDAVVSLMRTLAMRPRTGLVRTSSPVIFELTMNSAEINWRVGVHSHQEKWLLSQLRSTVPDVGTEPHDPQSLTVDLVTELRVRSPRRPLRTDLPGAASTALLAVQAELSTDESVNIQWLVGPWLPRHVPKPTTPSQSHWLADLADLVVEEQLDFRDARALDQKQTEAVFGCLGRIAISAATSERQHLLMQRAVGAVQLVREPGAGFSRRWLPSWWVAEQLKTYRCPMVAWPCPLNASELAELVMWPTEGVRALGVSFLRQRLLPPAPEVFIDHSTHNQRTSGYRVIGEATHPSVDGYVHLDAVSALQHLHTIGPTGSGKSTLLARLVLQDITAGRSVVVIAPKGDLVADLLDRIPKHRMSDVVLLDPTDTERPVGVNVLAGPDPELAVDQVVHALHALYAAFWGPRTHDILHAGLLTLAGTDTHTLVDLPNLLTDPSFRQRLIPGVSGNPALAQFWNWYEALSNRDRENAIGPVMNKLRAFTIRSTIRNLLGQTNSPLQWSNVLNQPTVLLVNLAKGRLGPETAHLLGALVISQLWQSILERSHQPQTDRHPAMVYVDEFQDYTKLPTDLGDALAQARGLGVGFTLAHQHLGQLTHELRAAVLNNARSRVVFQTGEDATALAKSLGTPLTADDLRDLEAFHAYTTLVGSAAVTQPASIRTLPLPPSQGTEAQVRRRSRQTYGQPVSEVEADIRRRWATPEPPDAPIGGRKRRSS